MTTPENSRMSKAVIYTLLGIAGAIGGSVVPLVATQGTCEYNFCNPEYYNLCDVTSEPYDCRIEVDVEGNRQCYEMGCVVK